MFGVRFFPASEQGVTSSFRSFKMSLLFSPGFVSSNTMLWKRSDFLSLAVPASVSKPPCLGRKSYPPPNRTARPPSKEARVNRKDVMKTNDPKGELKAALIQDDVLLLYYSYHPCKAYLRTWMAYFYGFHVGKSKCTKSHGFFSVPFPGISLWKGSICPLKTPGIHRVSSVRLFCLVKHLALASAIVRKTTEIFQQLPVKPRTGGQALESYQMIYA